MFSAPCLATTIPPLEDEADCVFKFIFTIPIEYRTSPPHQSKIVLFVYIEYLSSSATFWWFLNRVGFWETD